MIRAQGRQGLDELLRQRGGIDGAGHGDGNTDRAIGHATQAYLQHTRVCLVVEPDVDCDMGRSWRDAAKAAGGVAGNRMAVSKSPGMIASSAVS